MFSCAVSRYFITQAIQLNLENFIMATRKWTLVMVVVMTTILSPRLDLCDALPVDDSEQAIGK